MTNSNFMGTMIYTMIQSAMIAAKIWGDAGYSWFVAFLPTIVILGTWLLVVVFAAIVAFIAISKFEKRSR